jgi:hypothetical protein
MHPLLHCLPGKQDSGDPVEGLAQARWRSASRSQHQTEVTFVHGSESSPTLRLDVKRGLSYDNGMRAIRWTKKPERKYHNVPTNGFDSKREAKRFSELKLLERAGQISELQCQVRIELIPKNEHESAVHWKADFIYCENGEEVWEDCKGVRTKDYVIKRKIVWWRFAKRIRET